MCHGQSGSNGLNSSRCPDAVCQVQIFGGLIVNIVQNTGINVYLVEYVIRELLCTLLVNRAEFSGGELRHTHGGTNGDILHSPPLKERTPRPRVAWVSD